MKLKKPSCVTKHIAQAAYSLYEKENYKWEENIRSIGVRVFDLQYIDEYSQTDLFMEEQTQFEEGSLEFAKDRMRKRYGYDIILTGLEMFDDTLPVISPDRARLKGSGMYDLTPQKRVG